MCALLHSCTGWLLLFLWSRKAFFVPGFVLVLKLEVQRPQPLPYINPVPVQWTAATVLFGAARFPFWPTFLVTALSQAIRNIIRTFYILPVPQSCPGTTLSSQAMIPSAQRDPQAPKQLLCLLFLPQPAQQMDLVCPRSRQELLRCTGRTRNGAQGFAGAHPGCNCLG